MKIKTTGSLNSHQCWKNANIKPDQKGYLSNFFSYTGYNGLLRQAKVFS